MAEKRDYYEVLGLQKGAGADDIKAAYRKAALKWHPDRWVNGSDQEKKTAEEKFKEASEAYSVLSDPDKKAKYDQFGFAGVSGSAGPDWSQGFGDLNDIINNLFRGFGGGFGDFGGGFGGGFGRGQQQSARSTRGKDLYVTVKLSLEEIATGCEKEVTVERYRPCHVCSGRGTKNASDVRTCPTCNGSGQVQQVSSFMFTRTVSYAVCPNCNGSGKVVSNPCGNCRGTGVEKVREKVKVRIPAGVSDGMKLTLRGEGDTGPQGGTNGDLYVVIEEAPHQHFRRDGVNLFYTRVISVTDAILGTEIMVPCLDGPQKLKLSAGIQPGTVEKMRGKGLPAVSGYGVGRGDLYVKILVWIPHKLKRDEKEAIEAIRDNESFKPNPTREDRAVIEKEMNFF